MRFTLVIFNTYRFLLFFAQCLVSFLLVFKPLSIITLRFFILKTSTGLLVNVTFFLTYLALYFKTLLVVDVAPNRSKFVEDIYG